MKNIFKIFAILLPLWVVPLWGGGICHAQSGLLQKDGVYMPHLTTTQRNAISSPTTGQIIYNTNDGCLNIYRNGFWEKLNPYGLTISDKWTKKASLSVTGRHNAVAFSIGNKGYIGTGEVGSGFAKDFWEYDPTTNAWTQKADLGGLGRTNAFGFSIGTKGYIGTGYSTAAFKDFWEYNSATNIWTQKANFGGLSVTDGTERSGATGFSIGNKGYAGTGVAINGSSKKDFWEYNPATDVWTQKADFGGEGRFFAVSFSMANKGYIGTGSVPGTFSDGTPYIIPVKDFWEYNPLNNQWTQKADVGTSFERSNGFGFSIGSKGYIGSGIYYSLYLKDFWEYDAPTNIWTKKQDFAGDIRQGAVGFSINNKGYAGTGFIPNQVFNDLWEYDPIFTNVTQQGNTFNGLNQLLQLNATGSVNANFTNENFIPIPQSSFQNGWVNYGNPFTSAAYFKDDSFRVNLKGLLKSGTTTIATTMFTLPSGYRPSEQLIFMVINGNNIGRIDVLPTGEVQIHVGGNAFVSLDNISFRANGN
jgi:hypothetical protein